MNAAIKVREAAIKRLQTNPPISWSKEYTQQNITAIKNQIATLR